jgi:hypothetical protein
MDPLRREVGQSTVIGLQSIEARLCFFHVGAPGVILHPAKYCTKSTHDIDDMYGASS